MRSSILLSLLLVAGCAPQAELPQGLSDADEAAIRVAHEAFSAAQETEEVTQLGRFFTEDALWIPSMSAPVEGRAAIQAWFTAKAIDNAIEIQEVRGFGDLAYIVTTQTLTLDVPDWVPVPCSSLAVWEKQNDGVWLIARFASVCQEQPS
jgi:uncharacterized protein (TIGR02246 family)